VNRRLLAVIAGLAVVAAAVIAFTLQRPRPQPPVAATAPPAPPPRSSPAPPPVDTPAAPPPAPRTARREPARRAAPPPAPAPAPVEEAPTAGTLHIDSDVPGAQVFIDRQFIGATPVTAPNLKPGSHRLNVSAQGYEGIADTIEVAAGPREIMVRLKDVRLDAKIEVVHKHRIGSCKGRLVATPRGLRYETANKDDAFSAGLLDLGTFQVDYLEKNLRVATKSGKRYDFTDPEGNADRLFVFHRDVEKARERLKKGDSPGQ